MTGYVNWTIVYLSRASRRFGARGSAVEWLAMLRRWVMVGSTAPFALTCGLAVVTCFWRPAIGRMTEDVAPDGTVVLRDFNGVVFDNASIAVGTQAGSIPRNSSIASHI